MANSQSAHKRLASSQVTGEPDPKIAKLDGDLQQVETLLHRNRPNPASANVRLTAVLETLEKAKTDLANSEYENFIIRTVKEKETEKCDVWCQKYTDSVFKLSIEKAEHDYTKRVKKGLEDELQKQQEAGRKLVQEKNKADTKRGIWEKRCKSLYSLLVEEVRVSHFDDADTLKDTLDGLHAVFGVYLEDDA